MPVYEVIKGLKRCPLTKLLKGVTSVVGGCNSSVCLCIMQMLPPEHTLLGSFKNGIEVGDPKKKVHLYSNENYM